MSPKRIERLKQLIASHNRFVLTTHVNPDGDGLGSEMAFYHYLRHLGKEVFIWNPNPIPPNYAFLDPGHVIEVFGKKRHKSRLEAVESVFILDISDWCRLKAFGEWLIRQKLPTVCIDHHPNGERFAGLEFLITAASSTGEIVYDILKALGAEFTPAISEAVYTAVLTDTGSFRFNNTTPKAHRIAAELIKNGVDFQAVYENIYEKEPAEKIALLGMVLQKLHFEYGGRLVWFKITGEMLKAVGLKPEDSDGFSDFPRRIDGVEVSLMFVQVSLRRTKVSFRSKGNIIINDLAREVGGGGHQYASGAIVQKPLEETIKMVLEKAERLFSEEGSKQ
ncbi:bifunctional oligoribonuclease and PAP phosphatase NrnA [bacterium BMS3Abin05]|nr:bifunctional oligoribonuclease and PAP phosphatase NrnA [bacterium BMS3Abin05]HDZ13102.1 bifunctional oligoribonuclease/PAP phosphatase NrnA [Bacteroidota bacterium]